MSLENDIIKVRFKANSPEVRSMKGLTIFFTVLYSLGLPFVLWGLFYSTIFTLLSIREAPIQGLLSISQSLCIPLSMLVSIGKMWSHYRRQNMNKIRLYALLPFLTILFLIFISMIQKIIYWFIK